MSRFHPLVAATLVAVASDAASGQSLADRVARAADGPVQFTFAARPGVCGDGRTFIRLASNAYMGMMSVGQDGTMSVPCVAGPVRVVIDRASKSPIGVHAFVGPSDTSAGVTSLGRVRGQDAADFLLGLATSVDGRAGRDAIMPAMLADSARVADHLLGLARNRDLARDTRRTALAWLGRAADESGSGQEDLASKLATLALDGTDNRQVRQAALGVLSRLAHGAGIPTLEGLARSPSNAWLQKEATLALARSGDPRSRAELRSMARRPDLPDDVRVAALRSLGGEYATGQDAALLRDVYPTLATDRSRQAVFSSLADIGGSENTRWLLHVAASGDQSLSNRRRAVESASRAGAPIAELVKLYDTTTDPQLKDALVEMYLRSGEPVAIDKVLAILKQESDATARRRVISRLSRSDDPRIRHALEDLIVR